MAALGRLTWSALQFPLCDLDFNIFMTLRCQGARQVLQKVSRVVSRSGGQSPGISKSVFSGYLAQAIRELAFLQLMQRVSLCLRSLRRITREGPKDSVLPHPSNQRSALQAKLCSCTLRAAHHPTMVFKRAKDRRAFDPLQRGWRWI